MINLTLFELIMINQSLFDFKDDLSYIVQPLRNDDLLRQSQQLPRDLHCKRQLVHEKVVILTQLRNGRLRLVQRRLRCVAGPSVFYST